MEKDAKLKKCWVYAPWIWLTVILGLALVFRLDFTGGDWHLTFDEIFSVELASHSIQDIVYFGLLENSPPLFYILLHFWVVVFGKTDFVLQLFPLLASLVAVLLAFVLQKQLWGNRQSALLASVLVAASPFAVFFGREVRMYPFITASILGAFIFSWRYLDRKQTKDLVGYGVCALFASFLHYGVWPVVVIHAIVFLIIQWKDKGFVFRWLSCHFLLFVSMLSYVLISFTARSAYDVSITNHWSFVMYDVTQFFPKTLQSGFFTNESLQYLPSAVFTLIFAITVLWFLFSFRFNKLKTHPIDIRSHFSRRVWVLAVVFIPIIIGWILQVYSIKFFVASLSLLPLLYAQAIVGLAKSSVRMIVSGLVIGFSIFILIVFQADFKPINWQSLVDYTESRVTEKDLVLVHNFNAELTYNWYAGYDSQRVQGFFPPRQDYDFKDIILYNPFQNVTTGSVSALSEYTKGYDTVFVVNERGDDAAFWNAPLIFTWFEENGWTQKSIHTFSKFEGLGTVREYVR